MFELLLQFLKITLQWNGLATSSESPLLMIKVEKTLGGNIENQHLDEVCGMSILCNSNKCVVTYLHENNNFL